MSKPVPISWRSEPGNVLTVSLQVGKSRALPADLEDTWHAVVAKFARLGSVGGFSGESNDPALSSIVVADEEAMSATTLGCRFQVANVSAFAARALSNVVEFFHAKVIPLEQAFIAGPVELLRADSVAAEGIHQPVPFVFSDERQHFTSGFDIFVKLRSPQPDDVLYQIEDAYGHWFSAVNLGCFASPTYRPADCFVYPGDETQIDEDLIVLSVERSLFSEPEGIDSLVNVFQWVHHRVAEIDRVGISE